MSCPYDTNGDGDCHLCSKPDMICNGTEPLRLPTRVLRTVPRVMLDYGFRPEWIWYEMVSEMRERLGTHQPMTDMLAAIEPDQEADEMTWVLSYPHPVVFMTHVSESGVWVP